MFCSTFSLGHRYYKWQKTNQCWFRRLLGYGYDSGTISLIFTIPIHFSFFLFFLFFSNFIPFIFPSPFLSYFPLPFAFLSYYFLFSLILFFLFPSLLIPFLPFPPLSSFLPLAFLSLNCDLHVSPQVAEVSSLFEKLNELRKNGWVETSSEPETSEGITRRHSLTKKGSLTRQSSFGKVPLTRQRSKEEVKEIEVKQRAAARQRLAAAKRAARQKANRSSNPLDNVEIFCSPHKWMSTRYDWQWNL